MLRGLRQPDAADLATPWGLRPLAGARGASTPPPARPAGAQVASRRPRAERAWQPPWPGCLGPLRAAFPAAPQAAHCGQQRGVRVEFCSVPRNSLTGIEKPKRGDGDAPERFGMGSVSRARVQRHPEKALRFFDLRDSKRFFGLSHNPLVVGSSPTRPTNKAKAWLQCQQPVGRRRRAQAEPTVPARPGTARSQACWLQKCIACLRPATEDGSILPPNQRFL